MEGYLRQEALLRLMQERHAVVRMHLSDDDVSDDDARLHTAFREFESVADTYCDATKAIHLASLSHPNPHPNPHTWITPWTRARNMAVGVSGTGTGTLEEAGGDGGEEEGEKRGGGETGGGSAAERRSVCAFVTFKSDEAQKAVLARYVVRRWSWW